MKRNAVVFVVAFLILAAASFAQADGVKVWEGKLPIPEDSVFDEKSLDPSLMSSPMSGQGEGNIRSLDPFGVVKGWVDNNLLVLGDWKHVDLDHGFLSAEAFVLAVEENDGNVVAQLTHMATSQGDEMRLFGWNSDGEYKLLVVMNYGSNQFDRDRWYGTLAQWIGTSFQYSLEHLRKLAFRKAFAKFTGNQGNWSEFQDRYEWFASMMNYYLAYHGAKPVYPTRPTSYGYYHHFKVTPDNRKQMVAAVQAFFKAMKWPFADKNLFRESGTPSIINYDAP